MPTLRAGIRGSLMFLVLFTLMSIGAAWAQDAQGGQSPQQNPQVLDSGSPQGMVDTSGKFRLYLNGELGFGFSKVDVGVTTKGDTVSISGGGGLGLSAGLGYGLSRNFDLDLDFGYQASTLTPSVSNARGAFTRGYLLATLKYKIPTSDRGQFKFGLGVGQYFGGKLDMDTSDAPGGSQVIVKYETATGFHATGEFERFIRPNVSFNIGAKVYTVTYKADSAEDNHVAVPVSLLKDKVRDLDGSGMDFLIGINMYFN